MLGLLYDGKRNANLVGFANVDWARDFDSKSTSSHCFTLVRGVVSWSSKRQTSTTLSSTKAKICLLLKQQKKLFG
jgi:histone deacetylase 1/2